MITNTIVQDLLERKEAMDEKGHIKCTLPKPSAAVIQIIESAQEVKCYDEGYKVGAGNWIVMIPGKWIIGKDDGDPNELLKDCKLDPEDFQNDGAIRKPRFILKQELNNKQFPTLIYEIEEDDVEPRTYLTDNLGVLTDAKT